MIKKLITTLLLSLFLSVPVLAEDLDISGGWLFSSTFEICRNAAEKTEEEGYILHLEKGDLCIDKEGFVSDFVNWMEIGTNKLKIKDFSDKSTFLYRYMNDEIKGFLYIEENSGSCFEIDNNYPVLFHNGKMMVQDKPELTFEYIVEGEKLYFIYGLEYHSYPITKLGEDAFYITMGPDNSLGEAADIVGDNYWIFIKEDSLDYKRALMGSFAFSFGHAPAGSNKYAV